MTDLSKLSDAELQKLYQGTNAVNPLASMSDEDLKAAYGAPRGVVDKLLGSTGPRYQTWPEKLVRGALETPQNLMAAAGSAPPGSREFSENVAPAAFEAATLATPVNPAVRAGEAAIPGVAKSLRAEPPKVPTTQELFEAGAADIGGARKAPLSFSADAIANYSRKLQQDLMDGSIHPVDAEKTFAKLRSLENPPPGSTFTPANLQSFRESLGATAQNFNPNAAKDQLASSRAIEGLDQFLPNVGAQDIVAGTPAATQKLADQFTRGRGNYAAAMRSNDVTGVLDRAKTGVLEQAELGAQTTHSGRNIDNTIRQKVAAVLKKEKEVSGLSDAEISALTKVAEGGKGRNAARKVGNWLGGGGGLGQTTIASLLGAGGFAAGGVPGALVAGGTPFAVGSGARAIANQLAKRDLRGADEMMRKRSPLYEERLKNPNMTPIDPGTREALIRALMFGSQQ